MCFVCLFVVFAFYQYFCIRILSRVRNPSPGECNSHTKPVTAFLQTGLFLDFFSREMGRFRSTCARIVRENMAGQLNLPV